MRTGILGGFTQVISSPCADSSFTRSSLDRVNNDSGPCRSLQTLVRIADVWKMLRLIRGHQQGEEIVETQ
jgi:hypothetical protein